MKAALVIMAAGIGSRFGGVKQIEKVGPHGEILMDYSIYDAVRAGFRKIVFVCKSDIEQDIRDLCSGVLGRVDEMGLGPVETCFVNQDLNMPVHPAVREGRTKPLGTAHAVLTAAPAVNEPFLVINADDYYGPAMYTDMMRCLETMGPGDAGMAAYVLGTTLSSNGSVTRGICTVKDGFLTAVNETGGITLHPDGSITDGSGLPLSPDSTVSMNVWACLPDIFTPLGEFFDDFLRAMPEDDMKNECLLPDFMDAMIRRNIYRIRAVKTQASWLGVTYRSDVEPVSAALRTMDYPVLSGGARRDGAK